MHKCDAFPAAPGLHPVPGGVFPVPPTAVILMKLLPPPSCFTVSSATFTRCQIQLFLESRVHVFVFIRVPLYKSMS